jgi:hypothetical protein
MSNYPPGVTGNEYEIAGGNEFEEWFDCGANIEHVLLTKREIYCLSDYALSLFNEYKRAGNISEWWIENKLKPLMRDLNGFYHSDNTIEKDCDFSGRILKEEFRGSVMIECPKCETGYEESANYGY